MDLVTKLKLQEWSQDFVKQYTCNFQENIQFLT